MNKNLLAGLGVFLAIVIAGFFLVKKPTALAPTQNMPVPGSTVVEKIVTEENKTAREIVVTGTEYSFNPSTIAVQKGEKIKLTFVNAGSLTHDLVIDGLDVKTKLVSRGKSDTIEFTAEGGSVINFYCSVGNHEQLGMKGELTIQ